MASYANGQENWRIRYPQEGVLTVETWAVRLTPPKVLTAMRCNPGKLLPFDKDGEGTASGGGKGVVFEVKP